MSSPSIRLVESVALAAEVCLSPDEQNRSVGWSYLSFPYAGLECHCTKSISYGAAKNGSYSQYCLTLANYTTRIPEGLADAVAAPILCSGAT